MYRTPRSQPWVHACHVKGGFKKPAGKVLSHAFTLRAETEVCTIILYYTTQLESNKVSDTWIFWKLLNSRVDFNPSPPCIGRGTHRKVGWSGKRLKKRCPVCYFCHLTIRCKNLRSVPPVVRHNFVNAIHLVFIFRFAANKVLHG